ncbi:hypothetical protein AVEN_209300-1 [Araneus ventricosus]|uniref:Uncharacterized protein n=1 Tax=Araneus ventricosus TaxID=182803 RepID=A0A4Y2CCP4_ARAVE|nr:hypothetical protein AVEN_209300-1 [Araneus ventricosus]
MIEAFFAHNVKGFNLKNKKEDILSFPSILQTLCPSWNRYTNPLRLDILENTASYKIGLMKQFFKTLPKEGDCFKFLYEWFLGFSESKLMEGVFVEPHIKNLMKNENFEFKMKTNE